MKTDYTKILLDFKSIPRLKRTKTFMEISGYPHYENVCSNILKFYLDPNNEHGLKDLVLNSLVHIVNKDFKFDMEFEKIKISREIGTNAGNRLDLLIRTEKFVVGIENKIFHYLHNDLEDYKNTVKSYCYGSQKPICIVLSLSKLTNPNDLEKIKDNGFINITYEQIFQNIKENIGNYLNNNNNSYINYLIDFIKTIENLTPQTMENKTLWSFFKNNSEAIQELTESFAEYRTSLNQKVYQLQTVIPQNELTVDKQWIYEGFCLVHDYTVNEKYKIAVDTFSDLNGWEISLFARNSQSTDYLFNIMCKDKDFLPKPFESYERNERLIFQRFENDAEMSSVSQSLTDLIVRIENYKQRTSVNNSKKHAE